MCFTYVYLHFLLPATLYNATFETGDVPFAGTDATVFLQMFGTEGNTDKIEFPQDDEESLRFERGRTDKFAVETVDIGEVSTSKCAANFST